MKKLLNETVEFETNKDWLQWLKEAEEKYTIELGNTNKVEISEYIYQKELDRTGQSYDINIFESIKKWVEYQRPLFIGK